MHTEHLLPETATPALNTKKAYSQPRLIEYGQVNEVTQYDPELTIVIITI